MERWADDPTPICHCHLLLIMIELLTINDGKTVKYCVILSMHYSRGVP